MLVIDSKATLHLVRYHLDDILVKVRLEGQNTDQ